MKVVVDTSVWSLAFRRREAVPEPAVEALRKLIREGLVVMLGAVRQEVLSGIRHREQFDRLRDLLSAFPDLEVTTEDYEMAAELCNRCLGQGVQAAHTDFLIAAVAINRMWTVLSTDKDFQHIARIVPVQLVELH
ncbi:MAG: PIN domain-containing protein [Verrucomicrobiales bacterium]|nr:PIN domain-containing protein [Verrucomicrobiales bacterium]